MRVRERDRKYEERNKRMIDKEDRHGEKEEMKTK